MFFTVLTYLVIGLLAVFGLFYIVLEARFFRALGSVRVGNSDVEPAPKVSILIAARNESVGIRATLDSVLAQDYRGDWDVWVADDRSDDDTPKILADYAAKNPRLHVLTIKEIPEGVSPKKHALSLLIEACEGEILCLTDADCLVKPTWVTGIVAEFEPGIELVAGHSYIPTIPGKSSILICMQAVETLIYRVAGTAGLAMRLPLTSTGNNLAYRKSFFKSVHGFDNVIKIQSGDDDLLMQKLAADRPWAMRYCIAESTFVTTNGKETLKELWEQRKRWASKTIYYTPKIVFVLSMVFLFLVMQCIAAAFAPFSFNVLIATIIAFVAKCIGDLVLILRGLRIFKQEHLLKWCIPVEFIHAPFTVLAVLFGLFGRFKWK
ncbi:Glycosyltransferase, catalytic subunit of cellulose synthase and poly-beta-1,6-N-acetylglucosamine synthase [Fibrobacter sp. UWT2]|jgi:cellulose synthase/poly-beta-1,6-N-acetylglucosamine synthase-like glycosyltransferase|uniref:glycosyltransferase n=1 Tax=Fibrobacter sp. UWT2 TaxID=1896224 RepID=UPI0009173613|nr:glycosyltransferase [Fibrobacter sp. UWT2]SHL75189.1 Glycosyltransferase, catalytic subunit of cellulose synthase and poly-beta-1,6-N-acetylglucosamine synthase [Fibrobacter sp. UWT2]